MELGKDKRAGGPARPSAGGTQTRRPRSRPAARGPAPCPALRPARPTPLPGAVLTSSRYSPSWAATSTSQFLVRSRMGCRRWAKRASTSSMSREGQGGPGTAGLVSRGARVLSAPPLLPPFCCSRPEKHVARSAARIPMTYRATAGVERTWPRRSRRAPEAGPGGGAGPGAGPGGGARRGGAWGGGCSSRGRGPEAPRAPVQRTAERTWRAPGSRGSSSSRAWLPSSCLPSPHSTHRFRVRAPSAGHPATRVCALLSPHATLLCLRAGARSRP